MKENNLLMILLMISCTACVRGLPNILFIITDDMDLILDAMTPLNNTRKLIADKGITFENCFVAVPTCCPNRASILTGRYQHNHLTLNNSLSGGCSSEQWQETQEPYTYAAYLHKKNYTTFYAGKYLNQYGKEDVGGVSHIPEGWDWWFGLVRNSRYYSYSLSINGTGKKYGKDPEDYLTDVISNFATDFINTRKGSTNPFLMVLSPPAPHAPFEPAPRHKDVFKGMRAKRTPNFNTPSMQDKHWLARMDPSPLPDEAVSYLDYVFSRRWETLLAVDEMVLSVYQALEINNLLDNTNIIFTSDNGYHLGQFGLTLDKRQPYETDIHVPLYISGPNISPRKVKSPVSSVDLFATILDMAGLEEKSDGISLLKSKLPEDRTFVIEYNGERSDNFASTCPESADLNLYHCMENQACKCQDAVNNTYICIRRCSPEINNKFCIFDDDERFIEAYDLNDDFYELNNIAYSMEPSDRNKFEEDLKKMSTCKYEECVVTGSLDD